MLFSLKAIAITAAIPFLTSDLPVGDAKTEGTTCNCTSLSTKENIVVDGQTGQPFSGACLNEYRVEWISALKKKKMNNEMQAVVNGRKSINYYNNGILERTEEQFSSGHKSAEYHFATGEKGAVVYHGAARQWHENGSNKYAGTFENGLPVGEHVWYDSRGSRVELRKVTAVNTTNVTVDIEQTQWYDYQSKKSITRFTAIWDGKTAVTDKKNVSFFSFYPSGKKKEVTIYDSMSSGYTKHEFYDEKGNLIQGGDKLQMK
ncbi:MAG TPA: hypothetical protein PK637_01670 [Flavobacteriales bacterium]|nr:hypothetical protein [Flavobacteriales bacterium]HRE74939.1 hypothetical protein [Flavobacteriales bacterium]HRE95441.1 hypothetical protein [Flavobacteriales bacterium]HRJ35578.1 hypothetical protein [Flavobacteriales bacterium]HRJ39499.1 hypothetical protein [Flavobacteriales bacterium]